MSKTKQDLSQFAETKLIFNSHEHQLVLVMVAAKGGPLIDVPVNEIVVDLESPDNLVSINPPSEEIDGFELAVYKYNGKFLILTGRHHVLNATRTKQTTVQARFVSSPALKKARDEDHSGPMVDVNKPITEVSRFSDKPREPYGNRRYGNERY